MPTGEGTPEAPHTLDKNPYNNGGLINSNPNLTLKTQTTRTVGTRGIETRKSRKKSKNSSGVNSFANSVRRQAELVKV